MSKTLKFGIILLILLCAVLILITLIDHPVDQGDVPGTPEVTPPSGTVDPNLVLAVTSTLDSASGRWEIFDYKIDHIQVQDDGNMAIVWLAAVDPETGDVLAREPELALGALDEDGNWQVLLNDDPEFANAFIRFQYREKSLQGDLIPSAEEMPRTGKVYGGYYLPWAASLEKRLTWSVGHTSCYPIYYCTHAFDFADGTMFPILAAKSGTVFHWRDSCPNNTKTCTNSITLQDRSTEPWTYQIYLHIAQNSVPSALKQVGTPVRQGQFIANVDNTGYSTGHHVHFMVVTEDTRYFSSGMQSVWGVAEDITFRDVFINWDEATQGGRPRLAYEAETYGGEGQTRYVSGNQPAFPPTGGLSAPATKTYVTEPELVISGWGKDNTGVERMEILAFYGGSWVRIGEEQTDNPFSTTINLCESDIPNGPVTLGLLVWDVEGNPSPIMTPRKLIKDLECNEPGTNPTVRIVKNEGILPLPQNGFVSAEAAEGSTESEIKSVEFWFHGRSWTTDNWVYLGKDTNVLNGWQAPIITSGMVEANNYTIVAVATDSLGNQGVDVNFEAIVDSTLPWVTVDLYPSPVIGESVTLTWTGGDSLTGIDHYSLSVNINNGGFQSVESNLDRANLSYIYPVQPEQFLIFALTAHDKSGNQASHNVATYTAGYVFEHYTIYPIFFNEN